MTDQDSRLRVLLDHLDSVFYGKAWHGPALLPTVRRVGYARAGLEDGEGFSAWKVALHCAYWKYVVRRTISIDEDIGAFARKPKDFPRLPVPADEKQWKADIAFLAEEHRLLREAVERFPVDRLEEVPPKGQFSYAGYILGAASHDVYHAAHIRNLGIRAG